MALVAPTRRKPAAHQRKRQAQHHRQSKQYVKAYWPYLPMLLVVGLGLMVNSLWAHSGVLGTNQDFSTSSLLVATNLQRSAYNEVPLSIDAQLTAAAQAKANDMVTRNYWAHNSPSGQTPWSFITASGYQYQSAGENLAYGFDSANSTVTAWMNSAEHRANILAVNYENIGFGVAQSANYRGLGPETIVVAEYGQPVTATGLATTQTLPPTEVAAQPVSRIELLTGGQAAWSVAAVVALTGVLFALLLVRHGLRFHRTFVRGERFVAHHPLVDIVVTVLVTAGVLLTRSSGMIR